LRSVSDGTLLRSASVQAGSVTSGSLPRAADIAEAILTNRAAALAGGAAAVIVADVAGTILTNQAAALAVETDPAGAEDAVATALTNRAAARTGGTFQAAAVVQAVSRRPLSAESQPEKGAVAVEAKAAPESMPVKADARQAVAPGVPAAADAAAEAGTRTAEAAGIAAAARPVAEAGLTEQAQDAAEGPEPLPRVKAVGAQPRAAAAEAVKVQPAEPRQVSGKGQSAGAEPESGRGDAQASKRPAQDKQSTPEVAAARQAPTEPRTEQAGAAARTEAPRSAFEPDTGTQLARASLGALGRGDREYRLKLRPEGVGEVAVTIGAQGRELRLTIRASQESTRELILGQIGTLKEQLEDSGYRLSGFSVDVSGGNGGGSGGQAPAFQQSPERQPEAHRGARPEAAPQPQPKEPTRAAPNVWQGAINYRI
jgi:flagellar hook-length control protein FliK